MTALYDDRRTRQVRARYRPSRPLLTYTIRGATVPFMIADVPRFIMMKQFLDKIGEWLGKAMEVRYVSVPVWKPWRDF
jgi:hypothetical protein